MNEIKGPTISPIETDKRIASDGSLEQVDHKGDDAPQEEELHRTLSHTQVGMIAIGGAIGTGLILGSGPGLVQAGPAGLLIAYIIMGTVCYGVLSAMGELSCYMPHKRGFAGHASQFVEEGFGFAVGVNYLLKYLVVTPAQLNASALIISYWRPDLSGGIWITVFGAAIVALNILGGVRFFGHVEFWLSLAKIIVLVGLIILMVVINTGGTPQGEYIGFRNWGGGRAFREYRAEGALGRFLGTWSAFVSALYAYMGSELIGVTVGECKNPRKAIPRAIRSTFFRIAVFYVGLIFLIGLNVPADSPLLLTATRSSGTAAASPFVVAIRIAEIQVLPGFLNACLLIFTFSAANSDLYIASRTLYSLAKSKQAPKWFLICNSQGTPWVCLIFCSLFISIAYINVASGGSQAFGYLQSCVTIFGSLTWLGILVTHQRFLSGLKAQGIDRKTLVYTSPLQPYYGWFCIFVTSLVMIFKGWAAFVPRFSAPSFITNYIGLPVFALLWLGWKFTHKSPFIKASEMDLYTGARELFDVPDESEDEEKSFAQKITGLVKRNKD